MRTVTKHNLIPNGVSKTVFPLDRPDFNEWVKEIHSRDKVIILNDPFEDSIESMHHKQTMGGHSPY